MNRITNIKVAGIDTQTGSVVKSFETPKGTFYTRAMAYNQTYERLERTLLQYEGKPLEAIPIKVHSIRYLSEQKTTSKLSCIKDLTRSRIERTSLFLSEVQKIKREHLTNEKVVIFYLQIPESDWQHYEFEDLETFIMLMIEADIPHVTIPFHCKKSFVENKVFFDNMKGKLKESQDVVPQFSPKMKKFDGKQVLEKIFRENKSLITLVSGYAPNASHNFYYSYLYTEFPKNKLLIGVDVPDVFRNRSQKLPVHLALRRFEFDITTRKVTFPVGQKFGFPVSPKNIYIYDDTTGGMFSEAEQISWHGKSATEYIMENFPAHTGLSFREYVLCHNFIGLNRTGRKEADAIMRKKHKEYILKRPILHAFWKPTE